MNKYNPLYNLANNARNYIQNNSEKIKAVVKYGVVIPTVLAVGLNVLPKFQKPINKIIPTANTNISEVYAAEKEQGLYLWGPQIEQFAEANKNTWIMGEEFKKVLTKEEMNEFSEFEKKLNEFIDYTGMTHKLLIDMDMGKLYAIKIKPSTKTENGSIIYYTGNLEDKNSVRVGLGGPDVDINQYLEEILKGAYKYNDLLEQIEAKAQTPKISLADKVEETKINTISKIQEEKKLQEQKNLEDYVSEKLNTINKRFQIVDLEDSKKIPIDYNLGGISKENLDDKLLEVLNLNSGMKLSFKELIVQNKKVFVYNIIDSDDLNDGNITKYLLLDGRTKALFDEKNKDDSYTINIVKSKLGNDKIEPVMSDLILTSSIKKDYNLYRISDGETTFGFVLAPEKLAIEEVLKEYNLLNGAILGSHFKPEKIEPVIPPEEPVEPVTPPTPPTPPPTPPPDECEDVGDIVDNEDPVIDESQDDTTPGADYTGEDYFEFTI